VAEVRLSRLFHGFSNSNHMVHCRISTCFLTAALLLSNDAFATPAKPERPLANAPANKVWSSQLVLRCDEHKITLTSTCMDEQVDGLPLCPNQRMVVEGASTRKHIEYTYTINGADQEFITEAECFKKDDQAFLVLTATNFGNCAGCEWEDVFSPDGTYLGSTSGIYTNSGFRHQPLSRHLRQQVKAISVEKYRTADTGNIPRAKLQR
jgi:hypothetical protein